MHTASWLSVVAVLVCSTASAQQVGNLPEQPNDIEYATPQLAVRTLHDKPGVTMIDQNGWLVAVDAAESTRWYFPPATNPAYPAMVRVKVVVQAGQTVVNVATKCGGTKIGCDNMVLEFNERIKNFLEYLKQKK